MLSRLHEERGDAIDLDEWFDFGLRRLLDGLAVLIEGQRTGPGADLAGVTGPGADRPAHDVEPAGSTSRGDGKAAAVGPEASTADPHDSETPPQARSPA